MELSYDFKCTCKLSTLLNVVRLCKFDIDNTCLCWIGYHAGTDMYMLDRVPHWYRYVYVGPGTMLVQIWVRWIGYHASTDIYMLDRVPRRYGYVYVESDTMPVQICIC